MNKRLIWIGVLLTAAFTILYFWSLEFTYTMQRWVQVGPGVGYWETVTMELDPLISGIFLGLTFTSALIAVYGFAQRKDIVL